MISEETMGRSKLIIVAMMLMVLGVMAVTAYFPPPHWGQPASKAEVEAAKRKSSTIEDRTGLAAASYRHYLLKHGRNLPSHTYFGQLHVAAEMIEVAKARYAHLSQVGDNNWEKDPIAQSFIKLANAAMDEVEK